MWLRQASPEQRRTLVAASLGWMLDSMDILLYSMVLGPAWSEVERRLGRK